MPDRDPEAEAEEKVEEEKVPGADEVGTTAIATGFAGTATGDWEASAPAGFAAAQGANWDSGAADEWATATAPAPAGEWGATEAKESQW